MHEASTEIARSPEDRRRFLPLELSSAATVEIAAVAAGVRPGAAGLLIGIEYSRIRDNSWMYLTSLVTTRIGIELAAVQRKLPDHAVVGLQLYSVRTFHVNLSPRIYKGGQVPP